MNMYNPSHFRERRPEVLRAAIAQHPLATLVTLGEHGLCTSHIPLLHDPGSAPHGILRGHMARSNPQWSTVQQHVSALAIFRGPQHYISPAWYPSKQEHGKVVPTWNYVLVEAAGPLRVIEDSAWLLENVRTLTTSQEQGRAMPWSVEDAPADFIASLLRAIVGVEIVIERLEGKWKMSQNRPAQDRAGVIEALTDLDSDEAREVAELMRERP